MYPKQEAAFFGDSRLCVIEGSTKCGKSVAATAWLLERALLGGGGHYWWVSPVYDQAREQFNRLLRVLPKAIVVSTNQTHMSVTLTNSSVLTYKSGAMPDNLFGSDVRAVVVDEASRVKEASWVAVRSTLTATRGPVRICGNVRGADNWMFKLARDVERNRIPGEYHKITYHDAVDAGVVTEQEVEEAKQQLTNNQFIELYEATATDFQTFFEVEHLGVAHDTSNIRQWVRAWDLAATDGDGDYSVGLLCGRTNSGAVVVVDLVMGQWSPARLESEILKAAKADRQRHLQTVQLFETPSGYGKIVGEFYRKLLQPLGVPMRPFVPKTNKQERAQPAAIGLAHGNLSTIEAPWRRDFEAELERFPWGEHDDVVDALSMGYNFLVQNAVTTRDLG